MKSRPNPAATIIGLLFVTIAIFIALYALGYDYQSLPIAIIVPLILIALGLVGLIITHRVDSSSR